MNCFTQLSVGPDYKKYKLKRKKKTKKKHAVKNTLRYQNT